MRNSQEWCKSAFLQTGQAVRDLYGDSSTESTDSYECFCLLLISSDGLLIANVKWKVLSDQALHIIGFGSIAVLSKLFYQQEKDGTGTASLANIVDGFLLCGAV